MGKGSPFPKGNQYSTNKFKKTTRRALLKQDRVIIYDIIKKFLFMPLPQLKTFTYDTKNLTAVEALVIRGLVNGLESGDLDALKYFLGVFGVVELKAIAVTEFDKLHDSNDPETKNLNLTKTERLEMIERFKKIVDSEPDGC